VVWRLFWLPAHKVVLTTDILFSIDESVSTAVPLDKINANEMQTNTLDDRPADKP
jgi:hypothetical protein